MHCTQSFEPISWGETSFQTRGYVARLDLFLCSEMITTVSLSGYYKLSTGGEGKATILAKYAKQDVSWEKTQQQSLHSYFLEKEGWHDKQKKYTIPCFTGASCTPVVYPQQNSTQELVVFLTQAMAHEIVHNCDFLVEFWEFIQSPHCYIVL
jgi:hypothetical protein